MAGVHCQDPRIRRAHAGDLETLVRFAADEARAAEGTEKAPTTLRRGIAAALEDERLGLYWVLVDEADEPVGTVSAVTEWSNWHAGFYWWVQSFYIEPTYRGRGHAARLLDVVSEEARRRGGLDLRLYVHGENRRALRAYEKAGFRESQYRIMTRGL